MKAGAKTVREEKLDRLSQIRRDFRRKRGNNPYWAEVQDVPKILEYFWTETENTSFEEGSAY